VFLHLELLINPLHTVNVLVVCPVMNAGFVHVKWVTYSNLTSVSYVDLRWMMHVMCLITGLNNKTNLGGPIHVTTGEECGFSWERS